MSSLAGTERAGLCDLLEQSGPDAPTLCAGWTAYDLTAHLVLREHRPLAATGIVLPALRGVTAKEMARLKQRYGFLGLVNLLRSGPPRWSPFALPRFAQAGNALELFVHHEDVRRAGTGWAPRQLEFAVQTALWMRLGRIGRAVARQSPVGLELVRTDTPAARRVKPGEPTVTVRGLPSELVLFCFGRQAVADVVVEGDRGAGTTLALRVRDHRHPPD